MNPIDNNKRGMAIDHAAIFCISPSVSYIAYFPCLYKGGDPIETAQADAELRCECLQRIRAAGVIPIIEMVAFGATATFEVGGNHGLGPMGDRGSGARPAPRL